MDTAIEQTIVIIDDEDEIRTLMELALARPGRAIVGFADSSKALDYLREDRPVDAIISDVRMAGLDGYALVQRLQERGETAGTPVIFVSANDAFDNRLSAGGVEVEFLRKPFEIAELRARVDAVVARRSEPGPDFDAVFAGAVAKAGKNERPTSLLLVATVPPLDALSPRRARSTAHAIAGIVRAHLRRTDEAAMLAPYVCAASLDGCPPLRAREIASAIAAALHAQSDALGVDIHVGLGCAGDCRALSFAELFATAKTAAADAAVRADRFAMREFAS